MKNLMQWVLAATLICGTSVFTSCSSDNDDNPVPESGASGELVGKWYSDVSGATYAAWTFGKAWQQTEFNADGTGTTSIYYLNNDDAVGRERYSFTFSQGGRADDGHCGEEHQDYSQIYRERRQADVDGG